MVVSDPNKGAKKVESKKSSFFGSMLGFFCNHTKLIIGIVLLLLVVICFAQSFMKELEVYKSIRFAMNPIEIMFISVVHAVFNIVKVFIPFLLLCIVLKFIILKSSKTKIDSIFKKSFKNQVFLSLLISFAFSVLFYTDLLVLTKYSRQLVQSSIEIFVLFFTSVLFTISSMFGIVDGFAPMIDKNKK